MDAIVIVNRLNKSFFEFVDRNGEWKDETLKTVPFEIASGDIIIWRQEDSKDDYLHVDENRIDYVELFEVIFNYIDDIKNNNVRLSPDGERISLNNSFLKEKVLSNAATLLRKYTQKPEQELFCRSDVGDNRVLQSLFISSEPLTAAFKDIILRVSSCDENSRLFWFQGVLESIVREYDSEWLDDFGHDALLFDSSHICEFIKRYGDSLTSRWSDDQIGSFHENAKAQFQELTCDSLSYTELRRLKKHPSYHDICNGLSQSDSCQNNEPIEDLRAVIRSNLQTNGSPELAGLLSDSFSFLSAFWRVLSNLPDYNNEPLFLWFRKDFKSFIESNNCSCDDFLGSFGDALILFDSPDIIWFLNKYGDALTSRWSDDQIGSFHENAKAQFQKLTRDSLSYMELRRFKQPDFNAILRFVQDSSLQPLEMLREIICADLLHLSLKSEINSQSISSNCKPEEDLLFGLCDILKPLYEGRLLLHKVIDAFYDVNFDVPKETDSVFFSPQKATLNEGKEVFDLYCRLFPFPLTENDYSKSEVDVNQTLKTVTKQEHINSYLKDYSPRTFYESYSLFDDLFRNPTVRQKYAGKSSISIMDIGCGTGFASFGAIVAIIKNLKSVKEINVYAYDGNYRMICSFLKTLKDLQKRTSIQLRVNWEYTLFTIKENGTDRREGAFTCFDFAEQYVKGKKIDFFLSFKMINELIYSELILPKLQSPKPSMVYHKFASMCAPYLSESGFIVLLDIVMRSQASQEIDDTSYSWALKDGVKDFLKENPDYKCVIPIPCALFSDCLKCNPQRRTPSNLNEGGRNESYSYWVLARTSFQKAIFHSVDKDNRYLYVKETTSKKENSDCIRSNNEVGHPKHGFKLSEVL